MSDLFDLPFEEPEPEPEPVDSADDQASSTAAGPPEPGEQVAIRRVLSVTQVTVAIRDALEERFFEIWVEGELSNCKQWSGHLYFTLKDPQAQLKGFMFRSALRYLKFRPADGL